MLRKLYDFLFLRIKRIHEVKGKSKKEVAKEIEKMLSKEKYVNHFTKWEIIFMPDRFYVLVDILKKEIIGAVSVKVRDGKIGSLVVKRKYRGRGYGKKLLKHAIKMGGKYAFVNKKNLPARKLFEKVGFKVVGEREKVVKYEFFGGFACRRDTSSIVSTMD